MKWVVGMFVVLLVACSQAETDPLLVNDMGRMNPTHVMEIVRGEETATLQEAVRRANEENLKISIAGKKHSMGGHVFYDDVVMLDMLEYDDILEVNVKEKTLTVQSGATWDDVIPILNEYDLSVPVLQDYSGFSVGGSLSVNVHQSDPNYGPMIETVRSMRMLLANGSVVEVNRTHNGELFAHAIGGYGLFGIILDTTINLTENDYYIKDEFLTSYDEYLTDFRKIQSTPEIENVFARLAITKDEKLLRDLLVTTYAETAATDEAPHELVPDRVGLKKFFFGLSRSDWGKKVRWYLQSKHSDIVEPKYTTRNNLDYNNVTFLEYDSDKDTDILQEYFVPIEKMPEFIDVLRMVVEREDLNLLSATIRYVPENHESALTYSPEEMFGLVLYFNVPLSEEGQNQVTVWTHELIEAAIEMNGTYYLPYQLYATNEHIRGAYPGLDDFFAIKDIYDPEERFINTFYMRYRYGIE